MCANWLGYKRSIVSLNLIFSFISLTFFFFLYVKEKIWYFWIQQKKLAMTMDPRISWVNVYSWYGHNHVKDQCLRPMGNQQSLPHKRLGIGIIFLWSHFECWQCVQMVATTAAWSRWVLTDREPPPETSWPCAPFVVHKKPLRLCCCSV